MQIEPFSDEHDQLEGPMRSWPKSSAATWAYEDQTKNRNLLANSALKAMMTAR
ncbi:hypothetical protein BH24ACT15_BH24ACT15_26010 [soil metagenome]